MNNQGAEELGWALGIALQYPLSSLKREFGISFLDNKNICAKAEEEAGRSEASLPESLDTV